MLLFPIVIILTGLSVAAEQCFETVNNLLATGNAISPYTVLLQLEFTQQAITSGAISVPEGIRQTCAGLTDANQVQFCADLQSSAQGPTIVTQTAVGTLNLLIDCFQAYINGSPDYQLSAGSYYNFPGTTPPPTNTSSSSVAPTAVPSPVARSGGRKKRSSIFKTLAKGDTGFDLSTYDYPAKSPFGGLTKRQQTSCSTVGACYEACRSCQSRDAICAGAPVGTAAACGTAADAILRIAAQVALTAGCSTLCGPFSPFCAPACAFTVPVILNVAINDACERARVNACPVATSLCAECITRNPRVCDPGTSQCCPSETGTSCGAGCCCCGYGEAPRGPNCECVPAP